MESISFNRDSERIEQQPEELYEVRPLNKKERSNLRYILAALGTTAVTGGVVKTVHDNPEHFSEEESKISQASISKDENVSSLLLAIQQVAPEAAKKIIETNNDEVFTTEKETVKAAENESFSKTYESMPTAEAFENKLAKWQTWWNLQYDQIAFTDPDGTPVGKPVDFQEFIIDKDGDGFKEYRLTPGKFDEDGFLNGGIAPEWIKYVRKLHAEKYDYEADDLEQINVAAAFAAALHNEDEPQLQKLIMSGEIKTPLDIVKYFAFNPDKIERGDEQHRTRAQYLYEELSFGDNVPVSVQSLLREHIIALAAKESKFDDLGKNHATAEGVMQLTDLVRVSYLFTEDLKSTATDHEQQKADDEATKERLAKVRIPFAQQVEFAGRLLSEMYDQILYWMKHERVLIESGGGDKYKIVDRPETYERLRQLFADDEDRWQREMLGPCVINAYNAGALTIGSGLHAFVAAHTIEQLQKYASEEYGLFTAFTEFARHDKANKFVANYGPDAEAYFFSIAAAKEGLNKLLSHDLTRLASNE